MKDVMVSTNLLNDLRAIYFEDKAIRQGDTLGPLKGADYHPERNATNPYPDTPDQLVPYNNLSELDKKLCDEYLQKSYNINLNDERVSTNVLNKIIKEEMLHQISLSKKNLKLGLEVVKERPLDTFPANRMVMLSTVPDWLQNRYKQIKEDQKMNDDNKVLGMTSTFASVDELPEDMKVNEDSLHRAMHPVEAMVNDWSEALLEDDAAENGECLPEINGPIDVTIETTDPVTKEVVKTVVVPASEITLKVVPDNSDEVENSSTPDITMTTNPNYHEVGRGSRWVSVEAVDKISADMVINDHPELTDEQQGLFRLIMDKIDENDPVYVLTHDDTEEILKTMKMLMTHCRIELLKDNLDLKRVIDLSEIAVSMKESSKGFKDTAEAIEKLATGDIFGPGLPGPNGEVIEEEHALGDLASKSLNKDDIKLEDEEDIEEMCNNMLKDIDIAKKTFDVVYEWYMSTHKESTVYDDILEKLQKDIATIQASTDPNGERKLKAIHEVISSIESRDSKFLLESLYNKTENPKRLREVAKDYIRCGNKLYNKLHAIGFSREDMQNFISFFITEAVFRNIYNTGDTYIEVDPKWLAGVPKEEYEKMLVREISAVCCFFLYHLMKICEAEKKREYYLTIKYRLGIILICDTNLKCPFNKKTFRSRFVEPITEEPITETEFSLERSKLFDMYMPLLARYHKIMGDKTLFKYAGDQLRKPK